MTIVHKIMIMDYQYETDSINSLIIQIMNIQPIHLMQHSAKNQPSFVLSTYYIIDRAQMGCRPYEAPLYSQSVV